MNPPGVQLSVARGLGTRLGFRRPWAVPAIWRHAAYDLEGGVGCLWCGQWLFRQEVLMEGQKLSASGGRW